MPPTNILLLGAGELGLAVLNPLSHLKDLSITLAIRNPTKYTHLASSKISLLELDYLTASEASLAELFTTYPIIISCTGFAAPLGTQLKLLHAVFAAGDLRQGSGKGELWYFPWQWGVDYDATATQGEGLGYDAHELMPLFGENVVVRDELRGGAAGHGVCWTVVSVGIFMSFLFEGFWGVVGEGDGKGEVLVRALGGWENAVTVTRVEDIGAVAAAVVDAGLRSAGSAVDVKDTILYAAGETVTYGRLAEIVGRVTGREVRKEVWTVEFLKEELEKDREDGLKRYRLVFAGGKGVHWPEEGTVNRKLGVSVMGVEEWMRENYKM